MGAQVRTIVRGDWSITVLTNGWTGRPEGGAISEAITSDPVSGGRAAGILRCSQGRVHFGVRWPSALSVSERPVTFLVRIDQMEPQTVRFQWADGIISGRNVREAHYISSDDRLMSSILRGRSVVLLPEAEPRGAAQISLDGLATASFDMTALCQGRQP